MRHSFLFIISYLAGQGTAISTHPNAIPNRSYTNELITRSLIIRTIKKSSRSKKKEKPNQRSEKAPAQDSASIPTSSESLPASKDNSPLSRTPPSRISSSGSLSLSPLSLQPKDKTMRKPETGIPEASSSGPVVSPSGRQGYQLPYYVSSRKEGRNTQAEGSVIATGPGVIRAQEGESPYAESQVKPGVIGRYSPNDSKHILTGGEVGYGRAPTPGRQRGQLAAYAKGDIVKVRMDLSKGGTGMIEDNGDSKIPYKDKSQRKQQYPIGTGIVERVFSASSENGPGASVKAQAEEPAKIDVVAVMKPPGKDWQKWSGGDLPE